MRFIRSMANLSQAELARSIGVSTQHVSRIELGQVSPSFSLLSNLCDVLQIAPVNLFLFPAENALFSPDQTEDSSPLHHRRNLLAWTGFWKIDLPEQKFTWSNSLYILLGYSPYSVKPTLRRFSGHVLPDDRALFTERFEEILQGLPTQDLFFRFRRRQGGVRQALLRVDDLQPRTSSSREICACILDITEWHVLENALLQNKLQLEEHVRDRNLELSLAIEEYRKELDQHKKLEQELRLAARSAAVIHEAQRVSRLGIWEWDGYSSDIKACDLFHQILGLDPTPEPEPGPRVPPTPSLAVRTIAFQQFQAAFSAREWNRLRETIRKSMAIHAPFELELEVVRHDEECGHVLVQGSPRHEIGKPGFIGTLRDITEISQREQDLREKISELDTFFSTAMDLLCIVSTEGYFQLLNPEWELVLGYPLKEITGRRLLDFVLPEDRAATSLAMRDLLTDTRLKNFVNRFQTRDGGIRWLEWRACLANGLIHAAARDVTEVKLAQAELTAAKQAAETANKAKSDFLAHMSHEIRTPLSGIMGTLEMLMDSADDNSRTPMRMVMDAAHSLVGIINDILDLSKIEAGKLELNIVPVDIRQLIRSCLDIYELEAQKKGLKLKPRVADSVPVWIQADELRLSQILRNLVSNAVKFTEQGAVDVDVEVEIGDPTADRPTLRLRVADTGPGIATEFLPRIFDAFAQDGSTRAMGHKGTGLGMPISKNLVEMMGGTIHVANNPSVGCTFTIQLPFSIADNSLKASSPMVEHPEQKSSPRIQDKGIAELPPLRVLLVEDTETVRIFMRYILERAGHHVETASNGMEALELMAAAPAQTPFDVILMDVRMPVLDGLETTRRIRRLESTAAEYGFGKRTPIIALTAHAMAEDHQSCTDAGMDAVVIKPLNRDSFFQTLQDVVTRFKSDAALGNNIEPRSDALKSTPDPSALPLVNEVLGISQCDGDAALWFDLLHRFVDTEAPNFRISLQNESNNMNYEELSGIAHKIKGIAAMLHLPRLLQNAAMLEQMARKNKALSVADGIKDVLQSIAELEDYVYVNRINTR
ncbi:ATP-binding protein [Desulfonatronum parangueonense]